ncbi:MAG TPA: XdhC family protein [Kofleriaceae bacterium]|nr:XdhC family protein [Kofleriaceae bacterium]
MRLLAEVLRELDHGRDVVLATVVATGGSTPRHAGARLAVVGDGRILGTIGGGRIEVEVVAAAREVLAGAGPRRVTHHLVRDLAMCCGGWMDLIIARPERAPVAAAVAAWRGRVPAVLTTAVADGALAVAPTDAAGARAARRATVAGGALREGIAVPERAIVFGLGHVARALGPLLPPLGYEVVVCDDGDTGALDAPPPWAAQVVESFAIADVERALGPLGEADHCFIITRDHAVDQRLLEELIVKPLGYLGMIGSRGKVGRFHKRLAARGVDLSRWPALRAPIGLDLGAETPEEIAIAIAAELVALRRRGEPAAGTWAPAPGHPPAEELP